MVSPNVVLAVRKKPYSEFKVPRGRPKKTTTTEYHYHQQQQSNRGLSKPRNIQQFDSAIEKEVEQLLFSVVKKFEDVKTSLAVRNKDNASLQEQYAKIMASIQNVPILKMELSEKIDVLNKDIKQLTVSKTKQESILINTNLLCEGVDRKTDELMGFMRDQDVLNKSLCEEIDKQKQKNCALFADIHKWSGAFQECVARLEELKAKYEQAVKDSLCVCCMDVLTDTVLHCNGSSACCQKCMKPAKDGKCSYCRETVLVPVSRNKTLYG